MDRASEQSGAYAANIRKYFLYTALKGLGFGLFTTMWIIYLQQRRGLSLTQATIVDIAFWIAGVVAEIPTGLVADNFGRKVSLLIGTGLVSVSVFAWALAPTMALIMLAYVVMSTGITFFSGADDAFFYESAQKAGRTDDYTRLLGRASATMLGASALGTVLSGLLASIDLILPFLTAGLIFLATTAIVITFKEPRAKAQKGDQPKKSYKEILRLAMKLMRTRPMLLFPIVYLALVSLSDILLQTFFVQPQAITWGIPVAGVGVAVMLLQISNMGGAAWSGGMGTIFGERRVLLAAPVVIVVSLILLAAVPVSPALLFMATIGFVTSAVHPLVMSRIQGEVPDEIRATMLSLQSLLFTICIALSEPVLGIMADNSGLPTAYVTLAASLGLLMIVLLVKSRHHFQARVAEDAPIMDGAKANV